MTATTATTVPTVAAVAPAALTTPARTSPARSTPRWRTGVGVAVIAALATTAVAAAAKGVGVPLEVDGEAIPLLGFAQMTLLCTAIGVVLAKALGRWAATPRRSFTVVAVALTAISFVPDVAMPATAATKLVLIATHVVAAAIVIPQLARRLPVRSAS